MCKQSSATLTRAVVVWPRTQITPTTVIIFRLEKFWAIFFKSLTLLTHVLKQLRLPVLTRKQSSATTSLALRHTTSSTLYGNSAVADDFASRRHLWPPYWSTNLQSNHGCIHGKATEYSYRGWVWYPWIWVKISKSMINRGNAATCAAIR